ncbi:phage head closure protein [Maritimibacter sp. DP07]|uniref:Phage head closure protein n=1 Tax=Maritimibacter harenae TaxID=2606218 RepID=A0A845M6P8_9RHOB|nr:phage head closure protein [Maritimibacter harenae]MZR14228.1 phage head closure protein [Maritimibacter harenae]
MRLEAGKMDRLLTIQRASVALDGYGGEKYQWSDLAVVWADVREISDEERWRAGQVGVQVKFRALIRWQPTLWDLSTKDRVKIGSTVYAIFGVKEIDRSRAFEITAGQPS